MNLSILATRGAGKLRGRQVKLPMPVLFKPFDDGESDRLQVLGIRAYHDAKLAGLNHKVHVDVPKGQVLRRDRKRNGRLFARHQAYALETLEFLNWSSDAADFITDIHLHGFVAGAIAAICNIYV
jgi:hypothetical protein